MMAHQRLTERVMQEFTVLPVRFGTVTNDFISAIPNTRKLLDRRFREFDELLKEMDGKVEMGLKAFWRDEKAVFEEILMEKPAIRKLRDSLSQKPPGVVRFEGIQLGKMAKETLEQKRRREATIILSPLRRIAHRVQENDIIVDRMILNGAFLVDKGREEEFDIAVRKLDEGLGQRLTLKYTGPNPPWNFVNIAVNWEEILKE